MDTPTLSPVGVGSPTAPPPLQDLSSITDMVTELTRPVDHAQLDQEVESFNLTYPVNVDDALNAFTLPPVAGTGTAPRHHHHGTSTATTLHHHRPHPHANSNPSHHVDPNTPHDHHHDWPTATRHLHPKTPHHHRHHHHHSLAPLHRSPQRWGRDQDQLLHGDDPHWTLHRRRHTTATTSPGALPSVT